MLIRLFVQTKRRFRGISSFASKRLFPENLNVLYDSKCSLCQMEVRFLQRKDTSQRIRFTDIEAADFDESDPRNGKISYEEAMRRLHAVRSDGEVLQGTEVIRAMYSEVNLGWLYAFTKLPLIGTLVDRAYYLWAEYRTTITRGESLSSIFDRRRTAKCTESRCEKKFL